MSERNPAERTKWTNSEIPLAPSLEEVTIKPKARVKVNSRRKKEAVVASSVDWVISSTPLLAVDERARKTRTGLTRVCLSHELSQSVNTVQLADTFIAGVDFVQEKFMGQGPQDNESAVEQAKDEQISDYLRGQYVSSSQKAAFVWLETLVLQRS